MTKQRNTLSNVVGLAALAFSVSLLHSTASILAADDSEPLVRELFVPFEDLDVVLKGGGRRVFLTRDEYNDLLAKASVSAEEPAPQATAVLSAEYKGQINGPRAIIRGSILIDVTASGIHAIQLPLSGVSLLSAQLDGKSASLSQPKDGKSELFVEGRGRHRLTLELVLPIEVAAAQQKLVFQVPQAGTGRFELSVPGNVEVKSGVSILQRTFDQESTLIRFLPPRDGATLVLSLNKEQSDDRQVIVARTVLVDELTETYERLHVTTSMQIPHGATEVFRFAIPDDFDITDVNTPLLSRWQVIELDGREVLEVQLQDAATDTQVLNISAQRNSPDLNDWKMPKLEPLNVAGTVSVVGLLIDERLEAKSLSADGLIQIDVTTLTSTLPTSIFEAEPGAPAITPIAAYFSPDNQFTLAGKFERPPNELEVASSQILRVSDSKLELDCDFTLIPLAERTFGCNILMDAGWEIDWLRQRDTELNSKSMQQKTGDSEFKLLFPRASRLAIEHGFDCRQHARPTIG